MGDPSVEVTEEKRDAAQTEKSKALDAISEGMSLDFAFSFSDCVFPSYQGCLAFSGKLDEAIDHLTEAIMLNPTSSILYATQGNFFLFKECRALLCYFYTILTCLFLASIFVKLKKPNAAICDAKAALEVS